MNLQELTEFIADYIRKQFDIGDDPDFNNEVNLFDYGFVDSLGAVEITTFLEEHFNVEISQKDIVMYSMSTVDEIAAVIYKKLR